MGMLYLVRHGQASFGAADYDVLSDLGRRQCQALGRWFATRGVGFDAVLRGTLKRHESSLAAIADGLGGALPEALALPGLNEYDGEAVVIAANGGVRPPVGSPEQRRHHFRLLREGLAGWMEGRLQPEGMPPFADWRAGVVAALDHVRARRDGAVLLVSSGGPISLACAHVLGTAPAMAIELNLRMRNSALTEFAFSERGHVLHAFNQIAHLDATPDLVTMY